MKETIGKGFMQETEEIFRLKVPFEDLYTSVFLIKSEQGYVLVDCATNASDVDEWIVPSLLEIALSLSDIEYLVLTHGHGDHAGGRDRVSQLNPKIKIISTKIDDFFKGLTLYELTGHTLDCIGVLDERSGTLISADSLQGAGVGKYRCSIESKEEYLKTLEKIRQDERIKNILFSHAYEPWYQDGMFGRKNVERCLQDCKKHVKGE